MRIEKGTIREDFSRDLFWMRLVFYSDDNSKCTKVLVGASQEYLDDLFKLSGGQPLTDAQLNEWIGKVISRWEKLGDELFDQDIHFDVYATTQEGEANGLDYLLNMVK